MRITKPRRKDSIFRDPVEHAIRSDDRRIYGAGQDEHAHKYNESMKSQLQSKWSGKKHCKAADEVIEVFAPISVGNEHDRKE